MAEYKGIKGFNVQTRSLDPTDGTVGDFYYNSVTGEYKNIITGVGAWSSGGSINTDRAYGGSAGENNESAMYFGGYTISPNSNYNNTEQYDGTSWSETGDLSNARTGITGSFGTYTAAVAAGGDEFPPSGNTRYLTDVEEWDGSSWSEGGDLTASPGQAREGHGVLTAGGVVAGYKTSGNAVISNYETYDGTSFTEQADLNTARQDVAATGSTTAALGVGGTTGVGPGSTQEGLTNVESYNGSSWTEITEVNTGRVRAVSFPGAPAPTMIFVGGSSDSTLYANVETYNGSAWTEITDLNTARASLGGAGQAQTDGIVFGGSAPSKTGATENWNGTTWTELNDLSTARDALANAGTGAASALAAMGYSTQIETVTEEFTAPSTFNQITEGQLFFNSTTNTFKETITDIAGTSWASGGSLNTARYSPIGSFGLQNANILAGGSGGTSSVEQYNGSSWTEIAEVNTARISGAGFGTSTAGIVVGGEIVGNSTNVESWNGSAWTEVNDIPATTRQLGGFGTSTSGLVGGGKAPTNSVTTASYTWDGTNWTDVAEINQTRATVACAGSSSISGIFVGGESGPPGSTYANTETWDGSSWTETTDINTGRAYSGSSLSGTTESMIIYAGAPAAANPLVANTESWNGSTWTEINDLATARRSSGSGGVSSAALCAGGYNNPPGNLSNTEEFTAGLANKTITTS